MRSATILPGLAVWLKSNDKVIAEMSYLSWGEKIKQTLENFALEYRNSTYVSLTECTIFCASKHISIFIRLSLIQLLIILRTQKISGVLDFSASMG